MQSREEKKPEREEKVSPETQLKLDEAMQRAIQKATELLDTNPAGVEILQELLNMQDSLLKVQEKIFLAETYLKRLEELQKFNKEEKTKNIPVINHQEKMRQKKSQLIEKINAMIDRMSLKDLKGAQTQKELLDQIIKNSDQQGFVSEQSIRLLQDFLRGLLPTQGPFVVYQDENIDPRYFDSATLHQSAARPARQSEEKTAPMSQKREEELSQIHLDRLVKLKTLIAQFISLDPAFAAQLEPLLAIDSLEITVSNLRKIDEQIAKLELQLIQAKDFKEKALSVDELDRLKYSLRKQVQELLKQLVEEAKECFNLKFITRDEKNSIDSGIAKMLAPFLDLGGSNILRLRRDELTLRSHLEHLQGMSKMLCLIAEKVREGGLIIADLALYSARQETLARYKKFDNFLKYLLCGVLPRQDGALPLSANVIMSAFQYLAYTPGFINLEAFIADMRTHLEERPLSMPQLFHEENGKDKPASETEQAWQRILRAKEFEEEKTAAPEALAEKRNALKAKHKKLVVAIAEQVDSHPNVLKKPGEGETDFIRRIDVEIKRIFPKDFESLAELRESIDGLQEIFDSHLKKIRETHNISIKIKEAGALVAELAMHVSLGETLEHYKKLIVLINPKSPYEEYFTYKIESFIAKLRGALKKANESSCENEIPDFASLPPPPPPPVLPGGSPEHAGRDARVSSLSSCGYGFFSLPPVPVTDPVPETPACPSTPVPVEQRPYSPGLGPA